VALFLGIRVTLWSFELTGPPLSTSCLEVRAERNKATERALSLAAIGESSAAHPTPNHPALLAPLRQTTWPDSICWLHSTAITCKTQRPPVVAAIALRGCAELKTTVDAPSPLSQTGRPPSSPSPRARAQRGPRNPLVHQRSLTSSPASRSGC